MFEPMAIKSRFKDYGVLFTDDFAGTLAGHRDSFFIVDAKIASIYRQKLSPLMAPQRTVLVDASEQNKTLGYCQAIIEKLIERGIKKSDLAIAIGGGIVQDLATFTATILFRGINWHFYPTTLLAQADSCIGGKSSINLGPYKNQIGTFYPPSSIVIDPVFLETLPLDDLKSGIGEILHYYLIDGWDLSRLLVTDYERLTKSPRLLLDHIRSSLEIKKKVIEIDEFDQKERNIFNYGHTFGHAIEAVSGWSVNHGQAVTLGMDMANYVSLKLGFLDRDIYKRVRELLFKNMPPFRVNAGQLDDYLKALGRDKKSANGSVGLILTKGPGSMIKTMIPLDLKLKTIIAEYIQSN